MAKNKKYVYLQLYPKDLLADEKLAKCDKASAWGAYLALLNIISMEPIRGCLRLRDWDSHPNNERKSLVANFRKAKSLRTRAAAFARVVAQCTPLKIYHVTEGIEQLIIFGVVIMYDDALIQPRMFRDSRSILEGYEPEPEYIEGAVVEEINDSTDVTHKKEKNNKGVAPARTLRANTHTRFESESENINNNIKGNIGGVGDVLRDEENSVTDNSATINNGEINPDNNNEMQKSGFKRKTGCEVNNLSSNEEKREETHVTAPEGQKIPVADCPPTIKEVQDYMQQRGEHGDPFRHITAEEFYDDGCQNGWTIRGGQPLYDWRARLRSLEGYRRKNGEPTVTQEGFVAYKDGKLMGTLAVRNKERGNDDMPKRRHQRSDDSPKHVDNDTFVGQDTW